MQLHRIHLHIQKISSLIMDMGNVFTNMFFFAHSAKEFEITKYILKPFSVSMLTFPSLYIS